MQLIGTMKKVFLILTTYIMLSSSANAQFKIHSNGNVSIQTTETPLSPVSINCEGMDGYHFVLEGEKNGLRCTANGMNTSSATYGGYFHSTLSSQHSSAGIRSIGGDAYASGQNNMSCFGIMAIAGGGKRNIGALGMIKGSGGGAGVYGSIGGSDYGTPLLTDHHRYAGYFNGDTKITGDLVVQGTIQGVLLGESTSGNSNVSCSELYKTDKASVTERLSKVSVGFYNYVPQKEDSGMSDLYEMDAKEYGDIADLSLKVDKDDKMGKQIREKKHYTLYADDLEAMFPDLVYENEKGERCVNYIEVIPLLVQSINELKSQIDALTGKESVMKSRTTSWIEDDTDLLVPSVESNVSRLFQNTPNPFTERTIIRFSLSEDVRSAYIYIFNMSGRMIRQVPVDASMESITVNGNELSPGIYLYSLVVNGQEIDTKKMIISK